MMVHWLDEGERYFEAGEYAKALECFSGHVVPIHVLEHMGWMYEHGKGVEKDLVRAACLYGQAVGFDLSEMPSREALEALLRILEQVGLEAQAAADGGDALATLGHLYRKGWGVERNEEKALRYYRCAAAAGNYAAMGSLGDICAAEGDFGSAIDWYEQCELFLKISDGFLTGLFGEPDADRAFEYLCREAELGELACKAPVVLGCMYECGIGVEKDPARAAAYYREALGWEEESVLMARRRLEVLGETEGGAGLH